MRANTLAKSVSVVIACGGLALAVGAATLGRGSPYRDALIVAGVDAFTIGAAAFILIVIFLHEKPPAARANLSPPMRSLDNPEGNELKKMLVRHVAPDKAVTIGFPADDAEAEQFAGQIGGFLHESGFAVTGFAAELPAVRLDPGIGIDGDNHILVGPIGSRVRSPASAAPSPAALGPESPAPAEALQASGLGSP